MVKCRKCLRENQDCYKSDVYCKECRKSYQRGVYQRLKQDPEWVKKERIRHREKQQRLGYAQKYKPKTEQEKARRKGYNQKWLERNKEKRAAHILLGSAVARGRISKGPCKVCGTTEKVQGHHEDYAKPLEVIWLCQKHHKELHSKS